MRVTFRGNRGLDAGSIDLGNQHSGLYLWRRCRPLVGGIPSRAGTKA
jgi:hypothetical protein